MSVYMICIHHCMRTLVLMYMAIYTTDIAPTNAHCTTLI